MTQNEHLAGLASIPRALIAKSEAIDSPQRVVLDMDSTEILVCGQQEQCASNGYFETTGSLSLVRINREGEGMASLFWPGNEHSAAGSPGYLFIYSRSTT